MQRSVGMDVDLGHAEVSWGGGTCVSAMQRSVTWDMGIDLQME
jgi:hypothetical protein